MKYDLIIFDADETLFDFRKSEREALKNTMLEFNVNYDENHHLNIYKEINTLIWKDFEKGLITQEALKVERFRRFLNKINIEQDEFKFADCYMKHLSQASFLFEESINLIKELHHNYRLAMITNGLKQVQENRIRKSEIAKYFEDIVISEEVGVAKPNPKIFEVLLNHLSFTDKSRILMVGDSLSSDISGGYNFGIDTCWYNPNKKANNTEIKPTYEISKLIELKAIL